MFMILRGVDGLYSMYTGDDRLGNQATSWLCGQADCTQSQTNAIVTAAEFAQMGLEMWIGAKFVSGGSFTCFVAGTRVVLGEAPDLARMVAGLSGAEGEGEAGSPWGAIRGWIEGHRWLAGVGCALAGLGVGALAGGVLARRRRDAREDLFDAALEEEAGRRRSPVADDDPTGDEDWDWLAGLPARL